MRRKLFDGTRVAVKVPRIHNIMAIKHGGLQNFPITKIDLHNIISKERRLKLKHGDANAMLEYFHKMSEENQKNFHNTRA